MFCWGLGRSKSICFLTGHEQRLIGLRRPTKSLCDLDPSYGELS